MATIGNFGKLITFQTSDSKVLTFNDFSRSVSANWSTHERIGKKPLSEFLGPALQTITFSITLSAQHGVKPRTTLEAIIKAIEAGQVENLVIGSAKVGSNKWKITDMSETWDVVLSKGELYKASLSLTLEEYL